MKILDSIGLTKEQIELRKNFIGGSDANTLLSGNDRWINDLWRQKAGLQESEDLSDLLHVVMGQYTEALNAEWYEKQTGDEVTDRNERILSKTHPFMAANLDGICKAGLAVWEAKHVNAYSNIDDVVQKYMPQLHHNGHCLGVDKAVLSIFHGTMNWHSFDIDLDERYTENLIKIEEEFLHSIKTNKPPTEAPKVKPVNLDAMRVIDMTGNNLWADHAKTIRDTKEYYDLHAKTKDNIKELIDDDVKKAHGHGVSISRTKRNVLTVKINRNYE